MADIFTHDLRAAVAASGCPVCRVVAGSVRNWIDSFWREGKNDPSARREFFAAGGFCREHALLLRELAQGTRGGAAVADVYRWLAERDGEWLARASAAIAGSRPRGRLQLERRRRCPACVEQDAATLRKLEFLLGALRAGSMQASYASSDGLCMPHLLAAATHAAGDRDVCRFLLDDARRRLAELSRGLDEYDRKRDHRFRDEPKGMEQLAPAAAIARYAGGTETQWMA